MIPLSGIGISSTGWKRLPVHIHLQLANVQCWCVGQVFNAVRGQGKHVDLEEWPVWGLREATD